MRNNKPFDKDKLIYAVVFALLALIVILVCIPATRVFLVGFFGYAIFAYITAVAVATVLMLLGRRIAIDKKHIVLYACLFFSFLITLHIALGRSLIESGWQSYLVGPLSTETVGGMLMSILTCYLVVPMGYLASLIVFLLITATLGLLALWPLLVKRDPDAEKKPLFAKREPKQPKTVNENNDAPAPTENRRGIFVEDIRTAMPTAPEKNERIEEGYEPERPSVKAERILFGNEQPADSDDRDGTIIPQAMRADLTEMERSFLTRGRGENDYKNGLNIDDKESLYQSLYSNIPVYTGQEDKIKKEEPQVVDTSTSFYSGYKTDDVSVDNSMYGDFDREDETDSAEPEKDDFADSVVAKSYIEVEDVKPPRPIADDWLSRATAQVDTDDDENEEDAPAFIELSPRLESKFEPKPEIKPEPKPIKKVEPPIEQPKKVKKPYVFPPIDLLPKGEYVDPTDIDDYGGNKNIIDLTLSSFGIDAQVVGAIKGPAVTRYELQLAEGVLVGKIQNISDNLAMRLKATSVRVLAPIKGKDAVGLEIPNKTRSSVMLRDMVNSQEFNTKKGHLLMALGKTVDSQNFVTDLAAAPHMLVAGQTGSGKSVCINTILISLLYKYSPDDMKLILVDPKQVELATYCNLPHMLIPQTLDGIPQTVNALKWLCDEMDRRYKFLRGVGANQISLYNDTIRKADEPKIPHIVFVMDEMADFMMRAKNQIEDLVVRLASLGRAAGIHLILATQRPDANVITSLIKSNIPTTIAFATRTTIDSQVVLGPGETDAKGLLGKGDMLFKSQSLSDNVRLQCAFIDMPDVNNVTRFIKEHNDCDFNAEADAYINPPPAEPEIPAEELKEQKEQAQELDYEKLCLKVLKTFILRKKASVSLIQQVHGVGFNKASRIFQTISEWGVISDYDGSQKPRKVLIDMDEFNARFAAKLEDGESDD